MKDHTLLDAVKKTLFIKNDGQLARALEVSPPQISKTRSNTIEVTDSLRIRILRKTGWKISELDLIEATGLPNDKI